MFEKFAPFNFRAAGKKKKNSIIHGKFAWLF